MVRAVPSYSCKNRGSLVACETYQERACSQRSGNRTREKVTVPASRSWRDTACRGQKPTLAFPQEHFIWRPSLVPVDTTMKNAFASSGSSPTRSESRLQPPPDISVENHGSIFLLRPISSVGQAWLQENVIAEETRIFCNAVVCEPRYVIDIVLGARAEGVVVR